MDTQQLSINKTAETQTDVHPIIKKRWSPLAFSDKQIGAPEMATLFEAASWAASAFNEQPWQYIYAHRSDEAGFNRLLSCLFEGNQAWAKDASVLVLSLARTSLDRNGNANRHYMHDTGAANNNMLLQGASMDIYGHMMGGFDFEKTKAEFDIEEGVEPVCFIALGYLGAPDQLPEGLQKRAQAPRSRKHQDDFTTKIA